MFCPNCGSQMPDGSKFCAQCGKAVPTAQQPAAPTAPQPVVFASPVKPVKKKKSKLPVAIIAVVLVVAIVVGVCFLAFGKKTEYLLIEQVTVNNGIESSVEYEYGENGVLQYFQRDSNGYIVEYTYNYDDDGRIESVEFETDGMTIELEYQYNDDGVLEEISCEYEGTEIVAECNENGQVETLEITTGGELFRSSTYTYYDNGVLESAETKTYLSGEVRIVATSAYSETGKTLKASTENDYGVTIIEQNYDDDDQMTGLVYSQSVEGMETMLEFTWENGKDHEILNPQMTMEMKMDGETQSVTIAGEVEWEDENKCVITAGDIDFDGMEEEIPEEIEDMELHIEFGDHGLMTEMVIEVQGKEFMSYTWEYEEVEVPRDYQKVMTADPIWGMFLS